MSAETTPIATPLSWLKAEIDRSLELARTALARTLREPADRAGCLAQCMQPVGHIRGALQMLNLEGAARFCSALEQAVQGFAAAPARLNELTASVVDRALFALSQFLDDLSKGEADVPLKLFPMYRELGELCERADVTENELFFPDVSAIPVHARCPDRLDAAQRERHVAAARTRFQRGLVGWIRQPNDRHALQAMRSALDALDQIGDQLDAPVGIWWVAAGLVDLLLHNGEDAERVALKPILMRLERLMRDVAGGSICDATGLMRDMLYRIAAAAPLCARVCDIRSLYKLDAQLPEFCLSGTLEYDVSALAPVLEQMRQKLLAMEEAWARYAAGSGEDLQRLRTQTAALKSVARDLGHYRLVRLLDIVGLIAVKLPETYPASNDVLALEMAAALLFMEGMLENFTSPPADIDQQVAVMVGWLLDALKPHGVPALGIGAPRDDITQRQHYAEVRAQVAREILTNLQAVEQTVDEIARNPELRDRIATLDAPVRQIAGALKMLGLSRANGVLSACLHLMRLSASTDASLTGAALEWVADGLSCLGFYLDNVCHDETPNEDILLGFVQRLSRDDAHPAGSIGWIPAAGDAANPDAASEATATMLAPQPADSAAMHDARELRAVYFGEARDVLAQLGVLLSEVRAQPENAAVLNEVRRAFHSLKGGARLVELEALAELAWEVERTLNTFLDGQWSAGDDLPVLIGEAMETVAATVQALEQKTEPDVAAYAGIIELAAALREPEPVPDETEATGPMAQEQAIAFDPATAAELAGGQPAGPDAVATSAEVEACAFDPDMSATQAPVAIDPVEEEIVIGTVRLSRTLYEIYLGESEALLQTVRAELAQWAESPEAPVPDGLVRAAHTLRSTASTLGFDAVAALATELEDSLLRLPEAALAPEHRDALDSALSALIAMFAGIRSRRMPEHDALAQAKLALIAADMPDPPSLEQSGEFALEQSDDFALARSDELALQEACEPAPKRVDELALQEACEPALAGPSRMPERLDAQLLPVFLDEAAELLPRIAAELAAWRRHPAAIEPARALARALHTLKGSARMAGAMEVGDLIHALESQVGMAIESGRHDEDALAALDAAQGRIVRSIRTFERPAADVQTIARAPDRTPAANASRPPVRQSAPSMSVDAESVDRLVDQAGEVSTVRLRIENEVEALRGSLHDLTDSVARLRSLLRETQLEADSQVQSRSRQSTRGESEFDPPAFDPLELDRYTRLQELTRMMAESLHDVQMIQQSLLATSADTEAALALQGRLARDLQQELIGLRNMPFGALRERLQRTVRQSAEALGRDAELHIEGEAIELDRSLLQRLAAPLEHMLRNALAHGIEAAPVRAALGKPPTGRIDIAVHRQGFQLVLTLADDGAGLDGERIRRAAQGLGLLAATEGPPAATEGSPAAAEGSPAAVEELPPASLFELIFSPGLSTAPQLTESSGRGIGLDVARTEIAALGGSIEVASTPGAGTTFRVRLPLALATAEVLLVRAATTLYAIPSDLVETVAELTAASLAQAYAEGMVAGSAAAYPLHRLSRLLGKEDAAAAAGRRNAVLLLRSGDQFMALHVDEIVRNQEAVLKPLGPQLARVPGLCGATVLGSNQLVLVIDPLRCAAERPAAPVHNALTAARETTLPGEAAHVMVVDDSLTVRRLTGRLLARAGYEVSTAKDGQEALQQIQRALPELVVLDLEMPRMDGFELVRELRSDPRTTAVPIVIVSSRLAEKHQQRAAEMGADAFFGKPYPEDELLACIAGLLGRHSTAQAA